MLDKELAIGKTALKKIYGEEFEKFVFTLLNYETKANNKTIVQCDENYVFNNTLFIGKNISFDAIAPKGIYDDCLTYIEIRKFGNLLEHSRKQLEQLIDRFKRNYSNLIDDTSQSSNGRIKYLIITSLSDRMKEDFNERDIELWTIGDIVRIGRKYPVEYNALIELSLSRNGVHSTSNIEDTKYILSDNDIDRHNENLLSELNKAIECSSISLVLGTGVSIPYNDLTWDNLVNGLYKKLPKSKRFDDTDKSFEVLGGDKISKAQYTKSNLGRSYPATLYNLLYPKKPCFYTGSNTLDECVHLISKICGPHHHNAVKRVITYNYDNFLEQALDSFGLNYQTLYHENDFLGLEMPIYHVHGFMPESISWALKDKYSKSIILSDEDYFLCYSNQTSWPVFTQLMFFKDDVCLFVGNSISDFNEKRLLHSTRQPNKSHFAIMFSNGLSGNDLARIHSHFFYELNIRIIWASSLADIPKKVHVIADKIK